MAIKSSIDIAAPIEMLWELTCDVERLPLVSPTFRSAVKLDADSPIGEGSTVRLKQLLQPALTWTITRFERPTLFEWSTRFLGATMTATHLLEPVAGGCRNNLRVELDGRGSHILERVGGFLIRRAINGENKGMKAYLERAA